MSSIALNSALTGLKAAQRSLDTISSNIANAQTVGYTRKILPQNTQIIGGMAVGVEMATLSRNVDKYLVKDIFRQTSISQNATIRNEFLTQIQDFHGASDAGRSISASIGNLQSAFEELSSSPDSQILLSNTVSQAQQTAQKFNDLYDLLAELRTQSEERISTATAAANEQINLIANLNSKINREAASGQSIAELEDQRDVAVRKLSEYMEVSTYPSDNGIMVVMTKQGQVLADGTAHELIFDQSQMLPTSSYPADLGGLSIETGTGSIDIDKTRVGGSIGALFTLRDETMPTYMAQADEMAQKMATRFDAAGLRLFVDIDGTVPASTTAPTAVTYVGFAGRMQVNSTIVSDPTLLRSGTNGDTVLSGSNEVIGKIAEYVFGASAAQQAVGVDISAGLPLGDANLQPINRVTGTTDLTDYATLDDAANITAPASFTLTINGGAYGMTINPGDTATDFVNNINTTVGAAVASLNGLGQLVLSSNTDIEIADGDITPQGLADLGLTIGITTPQNPSFTVQVGTQSPVTISVSQSDTEVDLLAALNAINGLTATMDSNGKLTLTPTYGGGLTLTNTIGKPLTALGLQVANVAHGAFRSSAVGAAGDLTTGLLNSSTLGDFARGMVASQSEDASLAGDLVDKESSFLSTLDARNLNRSGVDIDQELSELIRIQTAYSAAGRMVSASEKMFDELFNAFFG